MIKKIMWNEPWKPKTKSPGKSRRTWEPTVEVCSCNVCFIWGKSVNRVQIQRVISKTNSYDKQNKNDQRRNLEAK